MALQFAATRLAKVFSKGQLLGKMALGKGASGVNVRASWVWPDIVQAERDRWPLWLPVALGVGCGLYFALSVEPPAWAGFAALAAGTLAAVAAIRGWGRVPMALAAALLLGFGLARTREMAVATPILDHTIITHLSGRIESVEPRQAGVRLVLSHVRSGAFARGTMPARVRVALRSGGDDLLAGQRVSLTAQLSPPPAPVQPGAYDFGRAAYFQSIGAVGFVYGHAHLVPVLHGETLFQRLTYGIQNLRARMTRRIRAALPGSTGAIASALITGMRGGISDEDEAALRDAGLAHVLAIAGLHMALVGGGLLWLVRALLAAVPGLALNYPIKKWAAGAALAASLFYLVISGAAVPAVRAFVMLAVALVAMLLDRPALTMRSVALAAAILLVFWPESITQAGFQMSFAAVGSLVAVAEWFRGRGHGARGMVRRYAGGIAMTSLVGSLGTMPFVLYHFEQATRYAVLGNLIAMPVMGFWVMPAAALSVVLMPFGWDGPALHLLGQGIQVMVALGGWVSHLPGAISVVAAMPLSALLAVAAGGLWLVIWRGPRRWLGLAGFVVAVGLVIRAPLPDMLVGQDGQTLAIRGDDGQFHFPYPPKDAFAAREWLRRDGDTRTLDQVTRPANMRCDDRGCVVAARKLGGIIALPRRPEALAEDCARAAILVTPLTTGCKRPALVIDGKAAQDGEGWAIRLAPLSATSVREARGRRPWVRLPLTEKGVNNAG
jgi:competence protein ComEC